MQKEVHSWVVVLLSLSLNNFLHLSFLALYGIGQGPGRQTLDKTKQEKQRHFRRDEGQGQDWGCSTRRDKNETTTPLMEGNKAGGEPCPFLCKYFVLHRPGKVAKVAYENPAAAPGRYHCRLIPRPSHPKDLST